MNLKGKYCYEVSSIYILIFQVQIFGIDIWDTKFTFSYENIRDLLGLPGIARDDSNEVLKRVF